MSTQHRQRGRRRQRRLGLALVGGLAMAATAAETKAQSPEAVVELEGPFDDEERALYAEYQGRTPITTRRRADTYLEAHPDSIVGHFVLGSVLREGDGDLARAMYHLGRARELYEGRWPTDRVHDTAPWRLHRELLFAIQQVAGELEQHEYRLAMLEFHDQLYDPNLAAERAWPLLQLGRIDEAREQAQIAIESAGSVRRSMGRNALCAIEGHAGDRRKWFDACISAFEEAQRTAELNDRPFAPPDEVTPVAVHAYNAALAARASLRPDEVERLALAGARRLEFTAANPWALLVRLYLGQGRGEEATRALVEADRWRGRQPPALRDQIRADQDALAATLLLVAGEGLAARRLIDRAVEHPDRRGLTVTSSEHTVGAHALLRMAIRRTQVELEREAMSYGDETRGWWDRTKARADEAYEAWVDEGRIEKALSKGETMTKSLEMFVHGGLEPVPTWLLGDIVDVAGAGVVAAALSEVREAAELSGLEPYYLAIDVDIAWARGDEAQTLELSGRALDELPSSEIMLRARMAALGGLAALDEGEDQRALEFLETAMTLEPGVLRRMGVALPATIQTRSDSAAAKRAVALLRDSPRFDAGESGFEVEVLERNGALVTCMRGPSGAQMGCYEPVEARGVATKAPGEAPDYLVDDETHARALARGLHRAAFAMPLGLSSVDMGSLDGSATVAGEQARRQLERTLENLTRE